MQSQLVANDPALVFADSLQHKGLKFTRQRKLILNYLLRSKKHASPEEIYRDLNRLDGSLGRATVFRTLKLLEESGFADKILFSDGSQGYEAKFGRPHHDHMICVECRRVIEFRNPRIERLQERVARAEAFRLLWHRHEIFGLCRECLRKTKRR